MHKQQQQSGSTKIIINLTIIYVYKSFARCEFVRVFIPHNRQPNQHNVPTIHPPTMRIYIFFSFFAMLENVEKSASRLCRVHCALYAFGFSTVLVCALKRPECVTPEIIQTAN